MGIFAVGLVSPGSSIKNLRDSIPVCVAPGLWHGALSSGFRRLLPGVFQSSCCGEELAVAGGRDVHGIAALSHS